MSGEPRSDKEPEEQVSTGPGTHAEAVPPEHRTPATGGRTPDDQAPPTDDTSGLEALPSRGGEVGDEGASGGA